MNIFAIEGDVTTNEVDWVKSAQSQDNYRVVKMILESCHPSTKWVGASSANFEALFEHTMAMIEEYQSRFNKVHKCLSVLQKCLDLYDPSAFPSDKATKLPLAMPPQFHSDNVIESYRKFYASKPRIRYPANKVPDWFVGYRGKREYQVV